MHGTTVKKRKTVKGGDCKFFNLIFMDLCIVVWLSRNNQQDATLYQNSSLHCSLEARVSSGIPLIIRSSVFAASGLHTHVVTAHSQVWLGLDYSRSPRAYVNQRLQIQLELLVMSGMPLETCWASNERWSDEFWYGIASCWLFLLSENLWYGYHAVNLL
jgi:hypothetical protein